MTVQNTTSMPTDLTYGKVIGRFILAVADASDPDRLPDAIAADGTITFTPAKPNIQASLPVPATVIRQPITCKIDADGRMIDPQGDIGVWLITGVYKVTYNLKDAQLPGHNIEVLAAHTDSSPLDLTTVIPYDGPVLTLSEYERLVSQIATIQSAPVKSVNGQVGDVVLVLGYTKAEVDAKVAESLTKAQADGLYAPLGSSSGAPASPYNGITELQLDRTSTISYVSGSSARLQGGTWLESQVSYPDYGAPASGPDVVVSGRAFDVVEKGLYRMQVQIRLGFVDPSVGPNNGGDIPKAVQIRLGTNYDQLDTIIPVLHGGMQNFITVPSAWDTRELGPIWLDGYDENVGCTCQLNVYWDSNGNTNPPVGPSGGGNDHFYDVVVWISKVG